MLSAMISICASSSSSKKMPPPPTHLFQDKVVPWIVVAIPIVFVGNDRFFVVDISIFFSTPVTIFVSVFVIPVVVTTFNYCVGKYSERKNVSIMLFL